MGSFTLVCEDCTVWSCGLEVGGLGEDWDRWSGHYVVLFVDMVKGKWGGGYKWVCSMNERKSNGRGVRYEQKRRRKGDLLLVVRLLMDVR